MFPKVDYENFGRCKREQRRFAFKVLVNVDSITRSQITINLEMETNLVFSTLTTICALHIHDEDKYRARKNEKHGDDAEYADGIEPKENV